MNEKLFTALARATEQLLNESNSQGVANTAWAFATVKHRDQKLFATITLAQTTYARVGDETAAQKASTVAGRTLSSPAIPQPKWRGSMMTATGAVHSQQSAR